MKVNGITFNWEALGAQFANLDDDVQADFFKGMAKELSTWATEHLKGMQAASVASKLSEEDKKELESFLSNLYYKD